MLKISESLENDTAEESEGIATNMELDAALDTIGLQLQGNLEGSSECV